MLKASEEGEPGIEGARGLTLGMVPVAVVRIVEAGATVVVVVIVVVVVVVVVVVAVLKFMFK